jgi:prolipoprotein diacylglyceryltransferase
LVVSLPWGIDLWNATRHPTQIYELIAALIILRYTQDGVFGLLWFRKSDLPSGVLFLNFVVLTAGARLFLEAFRGDSTLIIGEFRLAQVIAWAILAILITKITKTSPDG